VPEVSDPPTISSFTATPSEIFKGNNSTLSWSVSNATTVSINQGIGNVSSTETREVGPTVTTSYTLTATNSNGTVTKSCTVTVKSIASAVTVTSPNSTICVGQTEQMTAITTMSDGTTKATTGTWGSDNTNVATVDQLGVVLGIGPGTATIYIDTTEGSLRGTKLLTVKKLTPTSVTVTSPNSTIYVGQTERMTATVTWSDGTIKPATGTWSSGNTNVATVKTVNQFGLVMGKQSGSANIYFDTTQGGIRGHKTLKVRSLWSKSGKGDNVFDMPTYVKRVRVNATYTGYAANFIVHINGSYWINELMGTAFDQTRFNGTYLTDGGTVEILSSSGVSWSFTQVLTGTAMANTTRKILNIPSKFDPCYRKYEIYLREAAKIK